MPSTVSDIAGILTGLDAGADVGAASLRSDPVRVDPAEQRSDALDRPARRVAAGEPEAGRAEDAPVGLDHQDVVG